MRIEIHSYPETDADFKSALTEALQAVDANTDDLAAAMASVRARVRESYPNARIVAREAISSYDLEPLWYAYRDGRVRPPDERRERLYRSLSHARSVVQHSDEVIEHSREAARRAGYR